MNLNAMPQAYASVQRNSRVNSAILADPAPGPDHGVRSNLGGGADMCIFSNHCVRSDANPCRDSRQRCDNCCRMNSRRNRRTPEQQFRCLRERHLWLRAPQNRFARQGRALTRNNAGRCRSHGALRVLRRIHVNQIARSRALRCRNSANFDRAVAFQPRANRIRQFLSSLSHRQPREKSYTGGSPSGLVFHRPCTHTHCSGCFLIISSITFVNFCVFSRTSRSASPVRINSTGGSKRKRYFPILSSQTAYPGTTAASVCSATRAIPVVVLAFFPKKSTKTASPGMVFWSARIPIVPASFRTFSITRADSFLKIGRFPDKHR